jgi:glucose uptake protein GlcU
MSPVNSSTATPQYCSTYEFNNSMNSSNPITQATQVTQGTQATLCALRYAIEWRTEMKKRFGFAVMIALILLMSIRVAYAQEGAEKKRDLCDRT